MTASWQSRNIGQLVFSSFFLRYNFTQSWQHFDQDKPIGVANKSAHILPTIKLTISY
jgi:hypothetical protein